MSEVLYSSMTMPGKDDITRHTYANGVTLLTRPNFSSPAVVVRGYLPVGAICDPLNKLGLASYVASSLMAGTTTNNFEKLNERVESIGASLSFGSGALSSTFGGQCLNEDLPTLLSLLTEILGQPSFPDQQIKRIKAQILTMLDIQAQSTSDQADITFDQLFYGTHPYALPTEGKPETIHSISRTDLVGFHQDYYQPSGLVLSIVGGIDPMETVRIVGETLGSWQTQASKEQPELPKFVPPTQTQRGHVPLKGKSQTDLMIGTLAPASMAEDYHIASLGNNILGMFGMMGRIGESVRERSGLAYYAQSSLGSGLGPVPWQVVAGVNPDNLDRAIQLIHDELERFITEPVTQEELDDSRTQMIGRMPLNLESNAGIAQSLLSIERYQLDLDYLRNLPGILNAITREDILQVAQNYWKLDRLVITSSGREL
ncbi:MAG: pitrilysin family protein [Anaerolineaceae bacterium]